MESGFFLVFVMIKFIQKYPLQIPEPSGLCLGFSPKTLLTVSDKTGYIYTINIKGETIQQLNFQTKDPEGICTSRDSIYVVDEKKSEIIKLDQSGHKLANYNLKDYQSKKNGLEGIAYNSLTDTFWLLKEKKPGLLIEWHPEKGVIQEKKLSFASDYSGITHNPSNNTFWIISDQDQTVSLCSINGEEIEKHKIPIIKAEGICFSPTLSTLFIVSDEENELFEFRIS